MATKIYGASDDLIEIDGDVYEEFGAWSHDQDAQYVAFSNGVLLRIQYTDDGDGIWRITPVSGPTDSVTIAQCAVDDPDHYSDVATITDPLAWVAHANAYATATKKD